jgi:release factor glutamine methyltransferase
VFVQTNTIREIKIYFNKELIGQFSENEIKLILKESVKDRLGITSEDYIIADNQLLSESDLLFFRNVVKRLQSNEPFQYILGKTEFFGLEMFTDERALIPRPETEELIEWISQEFSSTENWRIADICTGSGCIALALKYTFPNAEIVASDLSISALELAKKNSDKLNLTFHLIHADATKVEFGKPFEENSYDIWVSNPPYIPNAEIESMDKNVLDFEPHIALFVENEDPLLFYRQISLNALRYLKSGGSLFFELHENFAAETLNLLRDLGFVNIVVRKDLQGKNRMLKAQKA